MPFQDWTETIGSSLSEVVLPMWNPTRRHKINHLVIVIANGVCAHPLQDGLTDSRRLSKRKERLENPSVGKRAVARLPTARDEGLGRLLGGAGLGAQELQQFGVDFLCMRPGDAVRTTLDDHEARA